MSILLFGPNARREAVSAHTLRLVTDLLAVAGVDRALVTSTQRTPAEQARAMFENLGVLDDPTTGVDEGVLKQKKLYGPFGDQVIDVYVASRVAKLSRVETIAAMEAKIIAIGPSSVSRHCANPRELNVLDIAPSSIDSAKRVRFEENVEIAVRMGHVAKFLKPPIDPAYHIEVAQRNGVKA